MCHNIKRSSEVVSLQRKSSMEESTSRFVWHQGTVYGSSFSLPGSVRRVEKGPGAFTYWRLCLRVDGTNYIHCYRIRESETVPLVEALGSLVFLIYAFGLPSRLHSKRKGKINPTLPVGISGPHTKNKKQLYRVSIPGIGGRSKELRVYIENGKTAAALDAAKCLRAAGVAAYQAETRSEADRVIAQIWQLVEELDKL
jgi:hypothetical protein